MERPARGARVPVAGSRRPGPDIEAPEDIDPRELAPEIRSQLRTLSKLTADKVARHLVAAGRLVDDDPETALQHARAARAIGARVAVVREAAGETAYAAGEWAEAIAELRTARRMTGDDSALPLIADSERALGRPERALRIAQSDEVQRLAPDARAEMRIVEAGARRDLGQLEAALITLEDGGGLDRKRVEPWSARLWYAYADTLLALDRADEARDWFAAAATADDQGTTDADDRLLELDGITVLEDDDEDDDLAAPGDADPGDDTEPTAVPDDLASPGDADPGDDTEPAAALDDFAAPGGADPGDDTEPAAVPDELVAAEGDPADPEDGTEPAAAPDDFAAPGGADPEDDTGPAAVPDELVAADGDPSASESGSTADEAPASGLVAADAGPADSDREAAEIVEPATEAGDVDPLGVDPLGEAGAGDGSDVEALSVADVEETGTAEAPGGPVDVTALRFSEAGDQDGESGSSA